jgi:RNA polymerase sigma factor (sigma-70 family)
MHVFSRLGEYSEEKGSFEAWICGFAMNSVRTYRRREARVRNNSVVVDDTFDLAYEINPHDADQELVRDAVSSLDLLDQELLHMRFSLGMSSEEIADRSDLNPPQVRKRISRAMERLRRHPAVRQVIQ